MSDKVSIIVPCYHLYDEMVDMTMRCFKTMGEGIDEKILVDDGSPAKLRNLPPGLLVIPRIENGGYTVAVNDGLEAAKGDIIIVCNNDIEFVQPDWLKHLLKPLNEGYDISSIVTSDQGWETKNEITEDDRFGSLFAMKRKVYDTIGGFDERFGTGTFEDADYYLRAKEVGFRIAKNWAGIVEHQGRATFDTVDPNHQIFEKNKQIFIDKWGYLI